MMEDTLVTVLSAEDIQSCRALQEIVIGIIRTLSCGNIDPNTIDAIHFRLDWLHGILPRLPNIEGVNEQLV